ARPRRPPAAARPALRCRAVGGAGRRPRRHRPLPCRGCGAGRQPRRHGRTRAGRGAAALRLGRPLDGRLPRLRDPAPGAGAGDAARLARHLGPAGYAGAGAAPPRPDLARPQRAVQGRHPTAATSARASGPAGGAGRPGGDGDGRARRAGCLPAPAGGHPRPARFAPGSARVAPAGPGRGRRGRPADAARAGRGDCRRHPRRPAAPPRRLRPPAANGGAGRSDRAAARLAAGL
ncbi:MAG: Hydrolase, alpha/beta fold family, partial [uncultured Craurococcus sp.]